MGYQGHFPEIVPGLEVRKADPFLGNADLPLVNEIHRIRVGVFNANDFVRVEIMNFRIIGDEAQFILGEVIEQVKQPEFCEIFNHVINTSSIGAGYTFSRQYLILSFVSLIPIE